MFMDEHIMKWFFEDEARVLILQAELDSWLRTPYRHLSGVKGFGCDCIHFVVRVFENPELGVVPYGSIRVPKYNKDWHLHNSDELLYKGLKAHPKLEELPMALDESGNLFADDFMEGDILLLKYGKTMSHGAVYSRGRMYHSMDKIGVTKASITDDRYTWRRKAAFRVLA